MENIQAKTEVTFSLEEAAKFVGVSERTIRRHAEFNPKEAYVTMYLTKAGNGVKRYRKEWLFKAFPKQTESRLTGQMTIEESQLVDNQIRQVSQVAPPSVHDDTIKALVQMIEMQSQQIAQLIEMQQKMLPEGKKKGFFSRLFGK